MEDLTTQIKIGADASGVEAGVSKAKRSLASLGETAKTATKTAGDSLSKVGDGGDKAAKKVESATKSMQNQIQRLIASFEGGERGSRKFFESLARQRGVDSNALRPLLNQLDAVRTSSEAAGWSMSSFGAAAGLAGRAFALLGIAGGVRSLVAMADASTNVASRLGLVTASASELVSVQQQLFAVAQSSRVSFVDLAGTYAQMSRSTKELGVSQADMLAVTKTISQAVTISGGSAQSAQAALVQLSQGFAAGALRGEELNSIMEQTPRLAQAIADGMGVSVGKLRELGKAGELTAQAVLDALKNSAGAVESEFGRMAATVEQASTTAGNSVLRFVGVIDKITGASANMARGLADASTNLDGLSRDIERLASSRGLSDFFFLAFNNEKTLNAELKITQQQLVEVEARLARSPSNIYARQAAQDMRAYVAEIKEAQVRLAQLSGQSGPRDGRDQSGFTSRGQGYAAEAKRQAQLAEDLNAFKLKQSGVSPGYIKDVQEIIRLNKEGVLVGKDYVDALAKQQKALLDKGGANAAASKAERAATKSMRDQAQLLAELSGLTTSFAGDWDLLSKAYANGKVSMEGLTQAQAALLAKQPFAVALAKEEADAVKLIAEARKADAKAYADTVSEAAKSVSTVADRIVALEQEAQVSEMVRHGKISEAEAIELLSIARLREKATIIELFDPQAAELAHLKEEIAQREKLVGLLGQKRERKVITEAADKAAKDWEKTADSIESTLTDALMRGFESGKGFSESLGDSIVNMFKTYVAREIAASISKALMASMSGQGGWLSALGSIFGGATGGGGGIDYTRLANAAYKYYTGTGAGAGAGTISNGMTQSQMLASQEAGMGGGAGASSGSAAGTYMTYAAFIYAFAKIGSNLYNKGYTRAALGYGNGDQEFRPSGVGTTGAGSNRNAVYEASAENFNRKLLDSMGLFSEKWRDLLSGSTRMATLFGRKLKAFGLEATINGLDTDVKAFERYKGGLFRSNKTIKTEATEREVDALRKSVDGVRESAKAMARAMGYSDDAIDSFTGSIRVNFKNAKTGEEAAKRYAEAMEDLQRQMINTATGVDMSKEEFKEFMTGIQESIQAAGITTQGIGDIILGGMMGRLSEQEVGDQLADVIIGGIYNSIAGNYAAQIAEMFSAQIITPIFTAIAAGVPISQAISQTAISNIVKTAQDAATALNAIFSNAEFQQAIGQIGQAISGVSKAVTKVRVPSFGSARTATTNAVASERYGLETQLLNLLGNTNRLRQRELASLHAGNRALQQRIWALEDSKSAVDAAMAALERAVEAQRKTVQAQLDTALESESMLKDVFDTLRENIRELRGEVSSTASISAAEGREQILQAISGAITLSNDDLADAITAVRDSLDNQAFATKFERDRALLGFAGELDALAGITEDRLSTAEQTVTLLEEQLASLDSTLELAQKQIDALYGVDTTVKTVADAVLALNVAMSGYAAAVAAAQTVATSGGAAPGGGGSSGGGGGGGGSSGGGGGGKTWTAAGYWNKNPDLHKEYLHLIEVDPKQTDPRFTKSASLSYRDEYLAWHWANYGQKEKRRYAAGGYYPGGLALVGEEGPELINFKRPGQVYTARQTADLMRGEGAMSDVVKELKDMRKDQHDQAIAVLLMQQKLNKIVSRWDSNGIPEERVIA